MERFLSLDFKTMVTMVCAASCAIGLVWGLLTMPKDESVPDNVVPLHAA